MKKIINILSIILITTTIGVYAKNYNRPMEIVYNYDDVKNSLIRFHVLANSDNKEDQNLKLKVKDEIIGYLYSYLKDSKSLEESRKVLIEQEDYVKEIANKVIKENGFNYSVKAELGYENFPEKAYGSIVLPQGKYEAFRIIIGSGKGHNWWCVMFPPLCFTDVTKGQVEEEKSKEELDKVIEKEKKEILKEDSLKEDSLKEDSKRNNKKTNEEDSDNIKIKFKVVEIFKDVVNKK